MMATVHGYLEELLNLSVLGYHGNCLDKTLEPLENKITLQIRTKVKN